MGAGNCCHDSGVGGYWFVCVLPVVARSYAGALNGSGEADNWTPKSVGSFLSLILIGPGIILLTLSGMQALLTMQSGVITQRGGAKSANEAHRQWETYKATSMHMGWYMFVLNALILVMILNEFRPNPLPGGFIIGLIGIIAATIVLLVLIGKTTTSLAKKYPMPDQDGKTWGFSTTIRTIIGS